MVAVVWPSGTELPGPSRGGTARLRVVPAPGLPRTPTVRRTPAAHPVPVIRRRPSPAVYRRRRLVAALCLSLVLGLAYVSLAHLGAVFPGSGPLTASGGPGSAVAVADQLYVVRPGDTVWSIADRFQSTGDERPLVARIMSELHGGQLQAGQAIRIP
ncbi:MAG TPA: LysM peptidoglycan-binding domain-containing protein [Acidimicrobiales bacterium]|nr:LysM peptidoglycan-binding domain-containing protein [Acidimicrobiales bacterium]